MDHLIGLKMCGWSIESARAYYGEKLDIMYLCSWKLSSVYHAPEYTVRVDVSRWPAISWQTPSGYEYCNAMLPRPLVMFFKREVESVRSKRKKSALLPVGDRL